MPWQKYIQGVAFGLALAAPLAAGPPFSLAIEEALYLEATRGDRVGALAQLKALHSQPGVPAAVLADADLQRGRLLLATGDEAAAQRIFNSLDANVPGGATRLAQAQLLLRSKAVPSPLGPATKTALGLSLRWVPPGAFEMGSPLEELGRSDDEEPLRRITLSSGFWAAETEVTQRLYQTVTGANPSQFQDPARPVENVTWLEAVAFCRNLTDRERALGALAPGREYRLPTEAEWEYACRGGTSGPTWAGAFPATGKNAAGGLEALAWYAGNSGADHPASIDSTAWPEKAFTHTRAATLVAGRLAANPWGLKDMLGNVWEWCADGKDGRYKSEPVDGSAWEGESAVRVLRGGSFMSPPTDCRAATRNQMRPDQRVLDVGFRVVLSGARAPGRPDH